MKRYRSMSMPTTTTSESTTTSSESTKRHRSSHSDSDESNDTARTEPTVHQRPPPLLQAYRLTSVRGLRDEANRGTVRLRHIVQGDVQEAVLFNYMVDMQWLLLECPALLDARQVTILHGLLAAEEQLMKQLSPVRFRFHRPPLPISYGTHHSKGLLLFYKSGIRVAIHTANYIHDDWTYKTQGVWQQDFPRKSAVPGCPPTSQFEQDLVDYFRRCGGVDVSKLAEFDFTNSTVHLIASVPGYHQGSDETKWGHLHLGQLLAREKYASFPSPSECPLVCQFSSMGSLSENWIRQFQDSLEAGDFGDSTSNRKKGSAKPHLHLVFPTVENVRNSIEGYKGGGSIPVPRKNHKAFLRNYHGRDLLHQWDGGGSVDRKRAMPHIKTYLRYWNSDPTMLLWLCLTSANLSKAAWGESQRNGKFCIRSYELGVLFLPSLYARNAHALKFSCTPVHPSADYANIPSDPDEARRCNFIVSTSNVAPTPGSSKADSSSSDDHSLTVRIPVPYGLPPVPYDSADIPWTVDDQYMKPDCLGFTWPS